MDNLKKCRNGGKKSVHRANRVFNRFPHAVGKSGKREKGVLSTARILYRESCGKTAIVCREITSSSSFTEFCPPQRTEQSQIRSFPGTCASERTLLRLDRATFAPAIEPCPICGLFLRKGCILFSEDFSRSGR